MPRHSGAKAHPERESELEAHTALQLYISLLAALATFWTPEICLRSVQGL
jgi:hypothetical protein